MFCLQQLHTVIADDFDLPVVRQAAVAVIVLNFVFPQQSANAPAELFHHTVFVLHHLWQVDTHLIRHDAALGKVQSRLFVQFCRFQQRLAGDTADAQTGTARL